MQESTGNIFTAEEIRRLGLKEDELLPLTEKQYKDLLIKRRKEAENFRKALIEGNWTEDA